VYFKAKMCKMAMDESQAFDKIRSSRKEKCTVIDIKKLEDFIRCEFA
jgi:hypothetical protein